MELKNKTVGEYLREGRERAGLTVLALSEYTHIPMKHLEALESNRYGALPAEVYTKAMLRTYCEHCRVDVSEILPRFSVEYSSVTSGSADVLPGNRFQNSQKFVLPFPSVEWHPGFIIFLVLAAWVFFQARSFLLSSTLSVTLPQFVTGRGTVGETTVTGVARGARSVDVNGREVALGNGGRFETVVELVPGLNPVWVQAMNFHAKVSGQTNYVRYQKVNN